MITCIDNFLNSLRFNKELDNQTLVIINNTGIKHLKEQTSEMQEKNKQLKDEDLKLIYDKKYTNMVIGKLSNPGEIKNIKMKGALNQKIKQNFEQII